MKKLFVPLIFNSENFREHRLGVKYFPSVDVLEFFYTLDEAKSCARDLAIKNPKNKVIILESSYLIEPRKIEFTEKVYNTNGELVI